MNDNNNRPEQDRDIPSGLSSNEKENSVPSSSDNKEQNTQKNPKNPLLGPGLIANQFMKKMGGSNLGKSNPFSSMLTKSNPFKKISNRLGLGTSQEEEGENEFGSGASNLTKKASKRQLSSEGPASVIAKLPPKVKIFLAAGGGGFLLIVIIVVIIISVANMRNDRKTQQGYISGNLSDDELCEQLVRNGFAQSVDTCHDSKAYKFYNKIKTVVSDYQSEKNVNLIPGLIYETISYERTDAETYEEYTDAEVEALADAMTERVKETCYTYTNQRLNNGDTVCKKTKVEWTYNQISFDKYISYLKFGTGSKHPNYKSGERKIENDICQGPVDDTLCGKQQGNDSGSKKSKSSTTLSGKCPNVASKKEYPANACTGEEEPTGGTFNNNNNSSSFIELDGKDLTIYNQDKYKNKMCKSGCSTIISTSGCSAAAYSAAAYLLTNIKVNLPKVANDFCSVGAYRCGAGGVGSTIVSDKKLQSTYKIGGKSIKRSYNSFVSELKKNRVILISVNNGSQNDRNGQKGFNASSSGHYILLAKYNEENDQIYVYNPNGNRNSGWRTKADINKYVTNVKGSGAWYLEKK